MGTYNFNDIRVEKANSISRYHNIKRITILFRFVELFVLLIIVSRFSTQFTFSFKLSVEQLRSISLTLISPRSIFVIGNTIVVALFFISGKFSPKNGEEEIPDFYDEYTEKCRSISKEEKKTPYTYTYRSAACNSDRIKICRSYSENIERSPSVSGESRRELRRSVTEKGRKNEVDCGQKMAVTAGKSCCVEDEMSSEEFRRTVEEFIARQQRILREEEGLSAAVVPF